jgi:hypothetical protein
MWSITLRMTDIQALTAGNYLPFRCTDETIKHPSELQLTCSFTERKMKTEQ